MKIQEHTSSYLPNKLDFSNDDNPSLANYLEAIAALTPWPIRWVRDTQRLGGDPRSI